MNDDDKKSDGTFGWPDALAFSTFLVCVTIIVVVVFG